MIVKNDMKKVTLLIPVYNEEAMLPTLYQRLIELVNRNAVYAYLKEVKLYNPETVSITGMDNTSSAGIASPSLTTAGFSKVDVAKAVVDYLIHGADAEGIKTKKIPVFLVEGNSG